MRRTCAALVGLIAVATPLIGAGASAETYPSRAVRLIVPYSPGGPTDTIGRILAEKLSASWGQPVVIENRGGAGGNIGAGLVARSPADGYALLIHTSSHVTNASFYEMTYDPLQDFTPISELASYMLVLDVHPAVPARTLAEFVALARSKPGALQVSNAGTGSPTHLAAAFFRQVAQIDLIDVPYQGGAPATTALLAGEVTAMFNNPINSLPYLAVGKLRALAVTGTERLAQLPAVPTVAESGYPGFEASTWYGLFGPAKLPPEIVTAIQDEVIRALHLPDVADKLAAQGWDIVASPADRFAPFVAAEAAKWARIVRAAGIKTN
jgi:tripartite-type tricarboxylate transporter receptor subunit TctC